MRIIISAIALVFAIGLVLPTPADARQPRKVQQWGCTFEAMQPWAEGVGTPEPYFTWGGVGAIKCDKRQRFVIRLTLIEDVPGGANRILSRRKTTRWQNKGRGIWHVILGGQCRRGVVPTRFPVYTRMQVKRVGKPGLVRVASHNRRDLCKASG